MNAALAAPLARDPFMPRPPQGMGSGLVLALVAHALLVAALAFGVNWRTSEPPAVVAELWSAVPQFAAPRAVEAPPPPPAPPPAPPQRAPEPTPVRPPAVVPAPDAQIAIEKAAQRKEQLERLAAEREKEREKARQKDKEKEREKERDKARAKTALAAQADQAAKARSEAAERQAAADEKALAAKQALQQAVARDAYQKRMRELAGATGGPTDTGTALRSSGPSAGYAGRIMARIKPNIVFNDGVDGNPMATVEVKLAPDGTIIAKRLVKSSGVKSWDDAVLRAIERTEILPRDTDGRVPPPFQIDFRLRE